MVPLHYGTICVAAVVAYGARKAKMLPELNLVKLLADERKKNTIELCKTSK